MAFPSQSWWHLDKGSSMVCLLGKVFFRMWDYSYIGDERGTRIFVENRVKGRCFCWRQKEAQIWADQDEWRQEGTPVFSRHFSCILQWQDNFDSSWNEYKENCACLIHFCNYNKNSWRSERITKKSLFSMKILIYLKCTILNCYFYLIR